MTPQPRNGRFYGATIHNVILQNGTWLEGEEFTYPSGGFNRRAYAVCADGQKRVFRASIPDTYFSIPARGRIKGKFTKGFLSIKDEILVFTATDN